MNSAQIIQFARNLSKRTPTGLITDDEMLVILNKSYRDLFKKIVSLDRNYFWDRRTSNVVATQYEYSLKQPGVGIHGMFKPEKIRIKYSSTSDYVDVEFKDWDSLEETPEYYAINQGEDKPFCIITDTKYIHIFPTPKQNVAGGLLFEGSKKPFDLTITSVESDIIIDPLYHDTIAYNMCPIIEKQKGDADGKAMADQDANIETLKALKSMGVLTTKVIRAKTKDLSDLE